MGDIITKDMLFRDNQSSRIVGVCVRLSPVSYMKANVASPVLSAPSLRSNLAFIVAVPSFRGWPSPNLCFCHLEFWNRELNKPPYRLSGLLRCSVMMT